MDNRIEKVFRLMIDDFGSREKAVARSRTFDNSIAVG